MNDIADISNSIDVNIIEDMATIMNKRLQEHRGRLFILGIGGSHGTGSHAVNDFRKLCGIETHTPFDNASEMTARINDDGWDNCLVDWLKSYDLGCDDIVLILSVGGGNIEKNISANIVKAIQYVQSLGNERMLSRPYIMGIVGKNDGHTATHADKCLVIPIFYNEMITPYAESFQSIVLHLLVSHPKLQLFEAKWESIDN